MIVNFYSYALEDWYKLINEITERFVFIFSMRPENDIFSGVIKRSFIFHNQLVILAPAESRRYRIISPPAPTRIRPGRALRPSMSRWVILFSIPFSFRYHRLIKIATPFGGYNPVFGQAPTDGLSCDWVCSHVTVITFGNEKLSWCLMPFLCPFHCYFSPGMPQL